MLLPSVALCDNYFGQTDTPDDNDFVAIAVTERVHCDLATLDSDLRETVQQWTSHSNWECTFWASRSIIGAIANLGL